MELKLTRYAQLEDRTLGTLAINGKDFCGVLEDRTRLYWTPINGLLKLVGIKVKDRTAIPPGRYEVILNWSNRFKRILPRLLNVPQFDGILIHGGNKPEDTSGCLLVGTIDPKKNIIKPGTSQMTLGRLLVQLQGAKGKIFITVAE